MAIGEGERAGLPPPPPSPFRLASGSVLTTLTEKHFEQKQMLLEQRNM